MTVLWFIKIHLQRYFQEFQSLSNKEQQFSIRKTVCFVNRMILYLLRCFILALFLFGIALF